MVRLELTVEETRAAIALCDLAVKAAGLQVAEASFVIARKLETALAESQTAAAADAAEVAHGPV